jgi:hypothetical protein
VLCAGFTLLLVQSYAPDKAPHINCPELSPRQLASTFGSWFFLLLVQLNLGFILRETCCCAHHTFLLGFPTGCLPRTIKQRKKKDSDRKSNNATVSSTWSFLLTRRATPNEGAKPERRGWRGGMIESRGLGGTLYRWRG